MSVTWSKKLEGKYEIVDKLGEGGMGTVFKVRHRLLEEMRVVKTIRASLAADEDLQSRFLREARMASRLRHPNVADLYDFTIADDGTAYIVMEYIAGVSLDRLVKALGPLDPGVTLELAVQSLAAIGYLHRHRYVHRDVSPDNLMLSRDLDGKPRVKLIDLGIAKVLGEGVGLTVTGMFLGKLHYSSPEQLDDSRADRLDGRSDLYSFGVVLYELLTGRLPFEGTSPSAIMAGHLFRPPIPFEVSDPDGRIPEDLRAAILRTLSKDRGARFRNATELASELRALLVRCPADPPELERVMREAVARPGESSVDSHATSAQVRLDRQFGTEPTPPPAPKEDGVTRYLPPTPSPSLSDPEIAVLVTCARKFFEQGQNTTAREQLDAILALSPDHAEARELSELIELAHVKPKFAEAVSVRDFAAAEEVLLGRLEGAAASAFRDLWAELEVAKVRRAVELFVEAEAALGRQEAGEATELVAEALALGGDPVENRELLDAIDQALAREALIEELLPALEAALEGSRTKEARDIFDRIEAELGEEMLPADARKRLDTLEREQQAHRLATQGVVALEEDRLEDAVARFDEAATLAPEDREIIRRRDKARAELERRREIEAKARDLATQGVVALEEDRLEDAVARFDEAATLVPEDREIIRRRDKARAELERRREIEAKARDLATQGIVALEEDRLEDAVARFDEAATLVPEDREIIRRRDKARAELERRREIEAKARAVGAMIDKGDLSTALESLNQAVAALGEDRRLTELKTRLQALEARLDATESALAARDLDAAAGALEQLLELAGGASLAAPLEARRQQLAEELERVSEGVASVEAALDVSDAAGAQQALARLETLDPGADDGTLRRLATAVEALSQAYQRKLSKLLARVKESLSSDLDAAEAALDELASLEPAHPELEELRADLHERRKAAAAAKARAERLARWQTNVEQEIDAGNLEAARTSFEDEEEEFRASEIGTRLANRLAKLEGLRRVRRLIAEGERQVAADDLSGAETSLKKAAELAPEDDYVHERLDAVRDQMARREQEQQVETVAVPREELSAPAAGATKRAPDTANLLQAVGGVAAALEARDATRTRELLERFEAEWGKSNALAAAWDRLKRLEQE